MRAELHISLLRAGDGSVVARGDLAATPFWCRWDGATLWIVGSAATPVGEDDITIDLEVGPDVDAAVRSVAAMVIYAARGAGTTMTTRLHVADGASLVWQPEPVIVTARARHLGRFLADVAPGGRLLADEVLVLGRTDETPGRYEATTELHREGAPISMTSLDTAIPGWSGPGGTAGAKVVGTRVVVGPEAVDPVGAVVGPATVVVHPEAGGALATTLAADPVQARAQLDAALAGPSEAVVRTSAELLAPSLPVPVGGG